MSLTELKLPTKADFFQTIKTAASEMNNLMHRWEDLAEGINMMDSADLDKMGVEVGAVRADLIEFKTSLNEVVAFFKGESTAQTVVPANIIDRIRPIK